MTEFKQVGFDRTKDEALPGTVKLYERHLYVCTGPMDWPERIELGGGFPETLWKAIAPRAPEMPLKVKMTACDEESARPGYDILVFPDELRYLGVEESDFPTLIDDHLVGNEASARIPHEPLTGVHIFVCIHHNRDPRCGWCGPRLAERFLSEIEARGLTGQVTVRRSSHVGGHRFAGNVLVYPGGDWYGYVVPGDVPRIVDRALEGDVVQDRWRGRMGMMPDEQVELVESWR